MPNHFLDANMDDDHQFLMFSATFDDQIREIVDDYLKPDKMIIMVGPNMAVHSNIDQFVYHVQLSMRDVALYDLIISKIPARTVVFTNSKVSAEYVDAFLFSQGLPCTLYHSSLLQEEREDAM